MKRCGRLKFMLVICALALALVGRTKAETEEQNMKNFLECEIPGIKIQVNATTETRPTENMTVALTLTPQTDVYVEDFVFDVFGYENGTSKFILANITEDDFALNETSKTYDFTRSVPERVWGITYGEVSLTYTATIGSVKLEFSNITTGFPITQVENTYLKDLEDRMKSLIEEYRQLNDSYTNLTSALDQLNQTNLQLTSVVDQLNKTNLQLSQNLVNVTDSFELLNRTYWQLSQDYTSQQNSAKELENTRRVMAVLAITTVFFVATTIYSVMRRPRERW